MKPDETLYILRREAGAVSIGRTVPPTRGIFPVPARLDLANHSPTGFEFGYGGSGPSQSALAILADFTEDDQLALRRYQDFKWVFIAPIKGVRGEIRGEAIRDWLERVEGLAS